MQIAFDHIRMAFGVHEVLHDVCLTIPSGHIFALIGENGAGKSTLMNLLGGLFRPLAGRILLDGRPVQLKTPNDSIASGIAFIHQELNPVNDLLVYENIFLGRELHGRLGLLDRRSMAAQARSLIRQLDVDIDESAPMRSLDTSRKQLVEILRALQCKARVIIMDEPTTSLAGHEIDRLFELVRRLSRDGVTLIFISHKLNEVKELCSDYAVLRNGVLVAEGAMADATTEKLSELIVGRELTEAAPSEPPAIGRSILEAKSISRRREFSDISFAAHAGEILGFTGLLGDGRSEIFRSIFGDCPDYSGTLLLNGRPCHPETTADAVRLGIAYVPSNRKENAVVPDMSVLCNGTLATLNRLTTLGVISRKQQEESFAKHVAEFHLKCADSDDLITTLSGGNQQKVIVARWLAATPRVLILDNPTQGVDIGAKQEIYGIIRQIAATGIAVIVLSGDGQEIVRLCHRVLVLFHGKIAGELKSGEMTEQAIMRLATGAALSLSRATPFR